MTEAQANHRTERDGFGPQARQPAAGGASPGPEARARALVEIRAAIERAGPIEDARRPLEGIVETFARYEETGTGLVFTVVDDAGQPRGMIKDGRLVPVGLDDFLEELREKHPTLFKPAPPRQEEPSPPPELDPARRVARSPFGDTGRGAIAVGRARQAGEPRLPGAPRRPADVPRPEPRATGRPEAPAGAAPGAPQAESAADRPARDWLTLAPSDRPAPPSAAGLPAEAPAPGPSRSEPTAPEPRTAEPRTAEPPASDPSVSRLVRSAVSPRVWFRQAAPALFVSAVSAVRPRSPAPNREASDRAAGPDPLPAEPIPDPAADMAPVAAPRAEAAEAPLDAPAAIPVPPMAPAPPRAGGPGAWLARLRAGASTGSAGREPAAGSRPRFPRRLAGATAAALLVAAGGLALLRGGDPAPPERAAEGPSTTGAIPQAGAPPAPVGTLRGVPDVIDTSTLWLDGKIVRLFGVEWVRGAGEPDELNRYLRGREVTCEPASRPDKYRCRVEGQDLSRVVLYNGGGKSTAEATPDLKSAEDHARQTKAGLWGRSQP